MAQELADGRKLRMADTNGQAGRENGGAGDLAQPPFPPNAGRPSILDPLREKTYRAIWSASVLSNFGQLIQGVGAAWAMTRLTTAPDMVALVQTASMLPLMLVSVPAGAIADMFDRRKVALAGLGFACASAACLTICALLHLITPWLLLGFCFLIGSGVALYGPAWQSSIGQQVSQRNLPAAIALGSISYNVARSFGPAVGGLLVASLGAMAAFLTNALAYIPLILVFAGWRHNNPPPRLPPERIGRAIISGLRYSIHSSPIRIILFRTMVSSIASSGISALMPLVAKTLLAGTAETYGTLLGAYGVGAVTGALFTSQLRARMDTERAAWLCALITGAMIVVVGFSRNEYLTCAALFLAGAFWMLLIALLNIAVQLSAPRWVTARVLASFQGAMTGGVAIGAWAWGHMATAEGIGTAIIASGIAVAATPVIGLWLRMPSVSPTDSDMAEAADLPEIMLRLTPRSGPIVIELDYRVDPARAREFYGVMQKVRSIRLRTGGFSWSLSRDVADPELWTEHYHCPTWGDYLHQRSRMTQVDWQIQADAIAFQVAGEPLQVRRRLDRPFGSVRWQEGSVDDHSDLIRVDLRPGI
jgi:MFS family permease